jgi:hypothetical protein
MAGLVLSIPSEPERGRREGGSELADEEKGRDANWGLDWDIGMVEGCQSRHRKAP